MIYLSVSERVNSSSYREDLSACLQFMVVRFKSVVQALSGEEDSSLGKALPDWRPKDERDAGNIPTLNLDLVQLLATKDTLGDFVFVDFST